MSSIPVALSSVAARRRGRSRRGVFPRSPHGYRRRRPNRDDSTTSRLRPSLARCRHRGLRGVVATGHILEACRRELVEVVEEWVLVRVARAMTFRRWRARRSECATRADAGLGPSSVGSRWRCGGVLTIPHSHHGEIGISPLALILRQAGISSRKWETVQALSGCCQLPGHEQLGIAAAAVGGIGLGVRAHRGRVDGAAGARERVGRRHRGRAG